jgi:hypothetical protein
MLAATRRGVAQYLKCAAYQWRKANIN